MNPLTNGKSEGSGQEALNEWKELCRKFGRRRAKRIVAIGVMPQEQREALQAAYWNEKTEKLPRMRGNEKAD